jgi:hypothetical protein
VVTTDPAPGAQQADFLILWTGPEVESDGPVPIRALTLLLLLAGPVYAAEHDVKVRRSALYVDGTARWHGHVTSPVVWSERGDALAFTGRDAHGRARLVVVLVDDAIEATAFSWPVPARAQPARAVSWLGDGRVGAGPSVLQPKMVVAFSTGDE